MGLRRKNGVVLGGISVALLLVEWLGHAFPRAVAFKARAYSFQPDPELGYVCSWQKQAEIARHPTVLALGDSFTGGTKGIPVEKMYPGLVGDRTHREVLNLGCSGYGTLQEWILAKQWIRRLKPRWVIVEFFPGNDFVDSFDFSHWRQRHAEMPYELYRKVAGDNMSCDRPWSWFHFAFVGRSVVYTILYDAYRSLQERRLARFEVLRDVPGATRIGTGSSLRALKAIQELSSVAGSRFLVVLAVNGQSVDPSWEPDPVYILARKFMERQQMRYIDPRRALRLAASRGEQVFLPDGHWSAVGQEIVASLVVQAILPKGRH